MTDRGPFLALGALIFGILVAGSHLDSGSSTPVLVMGAAALGAAVWARRWVRVVVVAGALAALGGAVSARAVEGREHSELTPAIRARAALMVRGELVSDPAGTPYSVSVLVRTGHRTLLATASGDDAMRVRVLQAGDRVTLVGRLGPLHEGGFDDRARWRHAIGRLDGARVIALAAPRDLLGVADMLRNVVIRGTRALPRKEQALLAGFLLGDTRDIPSDVTAAYRGSGLSHLLAVSGENVAFVLALFGPVRRRLPLAARTALALTVVLVFAAMTRFEPSVLRASVMATIALLATSAGRPASRGRVLAYALAVLLLVDPFLLHSIAFLLSCGASAGIAFCEPVIVRRLPGPRVIREPLAVSLAAQIGVMPVLLLAFGSFPLVTPITNLAAAPAAEALGVYGLIASAVAGVAPRLGPLLQQPTALLVGWVTAVARAGSAIPLAIDTRGALAVVAFGAAGASVACLRGRGVSHIAPG